MNFDEYAKKLIGIKPAREVFVAFLDILGFSDFAKANNHDTFIAKYQAYIRSMIDFSLTETAEQTLANSSWLKDIEARVSGEIVPNLDNVKLNCVAVSDSILLSTWKNEFTDFMVLLATVRNLMAKCLYFGFPLRGAITYGMLTLDSDVLSRRSDVIHHQMLGLPLVEAANLEKKQNWSGCALHSTAAEKVGAKLMRLEPVMITFYETPIKQKNSLEPTTELMPVVNWVQGIADNDKSKVNVGLIRESFAAHGKKINSDVEEIINNTVKFYIEMSNHPVYKNEMSPDEYWNYLMGEMGSNCSDNSPIN